MPEMSASEAPLKTSSKSWIALSSILRQCGSAHSLVGSMSGMIIVKLQVSVPITYASFPGSKSNANSWSSTSYLVKQV